MSIYRKAAKRDAAEPAIVMALEAFGFSWEPHSRKGAPDGFVGKNGITRAVEIKTGKAALNKDQIDWWAKWRGNPPIVLRTVDDVRALAMFWSYTDRNLLAALASVAAKSAA